MAVSKVSEEEKDRLKRLDEIMVFMEILREIDSIDDMLGYSIPLKMKVLNKIDDLLDKV